MLLVLFRLELEVVGLGGLLEFVEVNGDRHGERVGIGVQDTVLLDLYDGEAILVRFIHIIFHES